MRIEQKLAILIVVYLLFQGFAEFFTFFNLLTETFPFKLEIMLGYLSLVVLFPFRSRIVLVVGCVLLFLSPLVQHLNISLGEVFFLSAYLSLFLGGFHALVEILLGTSS